MIRPLLSVAAVVAASLPAQTQHAFYTFHRADLASYDSEASSTANDMRPSLPYVFFINDDYSALCLGAEWRNGGTIEFDLDAAVGVELLPTSLSIESSAVSSNDSYVERVDVYINDVHVGWSTRITRPGETRVFDLTGFPALEGASQLRCRLEITGRHGSRMWEMENLKIHCRTRRGPHINPHVAPVGSCEDDCFEVNGAGLSDVDRVEIDGVDSQTAGWTFSVVNGYELEVCPPAERVAGDYEFEAFDGSDSLGTATLRISQSPFDVGSLVVDRLEVVTLGCFQIEGCDLGKIDGVRFGSETLSRDGSLGDGSWRVVNGGKLLEVCPPQCLPAGHYTIKLFRNSWRVATRYVRLVEPTEPKLVCEGELAVGDELCLYIHDGGAARPNMLFGLLSSFDIPSVIPGLLELGIGANFTSYLCNFGAPGPCIEYCIGNVPSELAGITLYFQGVVLPIDGSTPWPSTNVCRTDFVR